MDELEQALNRCNDIRKDAARREECRQEQEAWIAPATRTREALKRCVWGDATELNLGESWLISIPERAARIHEAAQRLSAWPGLGALAEIEDAGPVEEFTRRVLIRAASGTVDEVTTKLQELTGRVGAANDRTLHPGRELSATDMGVWLFLRKVLEEFSRPGALGGSLGQPEAAIVRLLQKPGVPTRMTTVEVAGELKRIAGSLGRELSRLVKRGVLEKDGGRGFALTALGRSLSVTAEGPKKRV